MNDTERLDFLDSLLQAGLPVGFKPNYRTLVGTVFIKEGPKNIREVIDAIRRINDSPDDPGVAKTEET